MIDSKFPYNWRCPLKNILYIGTWIKNFFQRGLRGYATSDIWNMDVYLLEIMIPMLRQLQSHKIGYPCICNSVDKWSADLDKIIAGFEANKKIIECDYDYMNKEEEKKLDRQWVIGSRLFVRYFNNLWD